MQESGKKYFPIRTETSCQLKWNWTALYLNGGFSRTCHRTGETPLTPENFMNFHNTEIAVADRQRMLKGLWPEKSCSYCRTIEESGGVSDRLRQIDIPNLYPPELDVNPTAVHVEPTIVEVFFDNVCNLGCLYCNGFYSSVINSENEKFGIFEKNGITLKSNANPSKELAPYFWEWFPKGFPKLKRLGVLGGEPLYQKETDKLLEMIDQYPNPDCELNIITNLMASTSRVENFVESLRKLVVKKKIRRVDITCSLDCWGPQQEYVRYGLDLEQWEKNFNILLKNKWIYLSINNTITVLTIKTLPDLLKRMNKWQEDRKLHHHFSGPFPGPTYFNGGILGNNEFKEDFETIISLMPSATEEDLITRKYMEGIASFVNSSQQDISEMTKLFTYLNEKDRRRNTNWRELFPWLIKYEELCGIQK